ncbi:fluoroacetate dehalogenase [Microbulbifer aestuariivivens]|uniref:Fluoroacetate dehalogenase n=1 Tax=Microbulbifer aestuariivivens TaxID=1908308 RepID=A0ABP9WQQ7_9GAMM
MIRRGYLDFGNGQLHYRYCGKESAPLLLMLHQTPSSSAMYLRLMPMLSENFFVVAVDTPGFGGSDPLAGDVTIEAFAAAIYQAVSAAFDQPALVFGHHTGAAIAVQLAYDQPEFVRALALSGPTLLTEAQKRALPSAARAFPIDDSGSHWQNMWQRLRGKDPEADLSLSVRETLLAFTCGDYYEASYRAVVEQDVVLQMAAINCPALVCAGGRDLLNSAVAPSVELLPQGRSAALPAEAGTYVCDRHPEAVADVLRQFFLEVAQTG